MNIMESQSQSSHPIEEDEEDESSVSTTATEDLPKSKKKKKSSSSKNSNKDHLTSAEREMYNSHAFQIRQNALQLLNHAEVSSPSTKYYKSYHNDVHHDATAAIQPQPSSVNNSYNNNNYTTTNNNNNDSEEDTSYGELNVSQVVTMAFGCIAHCLTESYRAASNYYSTTSAAASTQSNVSFNDYRYETVDGEVDRMTTASATGHIGELSRGGNVTTNNNNNNNTVSYQGYNGYQQTMERGANQSSGRMSTESNSSSIENNRNKVQGEYATVALPPTYQGGK